VSRCGFAFINGSAIKFINTTYNPFIDGCTFTNCGTTTHGTIYNTSYQGRTTEAVISNCIFEPDYYCSIESENGNQFKIVNNFFEGASGRPSTASIYGDFAYTVISDNYFYDTTATSTALTIRVEGDYNIISNNIIGEYKNGIQTWTGSDHNVISGNVIRGISRYGIDIRGTGNSVDSNDLYGNVDAGYAGIYCDNVNNSFTDNVIGKWKNYGLRLGANAHKCKVSDNYFYDNSQGYMNNGVNNEGNYNQITNNYIDTPQASILDTGAGTIIYGNEGYDYDSLQDDYIWNSNGKYWTVTDGGDITTNLQAAIDDIDQGFVSIPEGVFSLSEQITMKNHVNLYGAGINATVIKQGAGTTIAEFPSAMIYCNGIDNFTISGMSITGDTTNSTSGYNAIKGYGGCSDFELYNLHIYDTHGSCIYVSDGCHNGIIHDIIAGDIDDTSHGIAIGDSSHDKTYNIDVHDCILYDGNDYLLDFSYAHDCTCDNIQIRNSNIAMKVTGDTNKVTANCSFNNINMVDMLVPGTEQTCVNIVHAENCNFNNLVIEGGYNGLGMDVQTIYCTFNNININRPSHMGMTMNGYNNTCGNIIIKNAGTVGIQIRGEDSILSGFVIDSSGSEGISGYYSEKNVISDGIIVRSGSYGMYIRNTDDTIISNVRINSNTADGIYFYSLASGNCTNISILGCHIIDNGDCGIEFQAAAGGSVLYFIINGCTISDNADDGIAIHNADCDVYIITDNIILLNGGESIDDDANGASTVVDDNLTT